MQISSNVWIRAETTQFLFSFHPSDEDALGEVPQRGAGDGPLAWQQPLL